MYSLAFNTSGRFGPIVFTLKSNSTVYKVTIPWVSVAINSCVEESLQYLAQMPNRNPQPKQKGNFEGSSNKQFLKDVHQMENRELRHFQDLFSTNPIRPKLDYQDTQDPILKWSIWKPETKNIGIILLKSFEPASNNPKVITQTLRSLLV